MEVKKLHVRKGDTVMVISGKQRPKAGKKPVIGKVITALPKEGKVIVEGVNMTIRHQKPRQQGQEGGRLTREAPVFASKVMLYCEKCKKPVRVKKKIEEDVSGKPIKTRVCRLCDTSFDK